MVLFILTQVYLFSPLPGNLEQYPAGHLNKIKIMAFSIFCAVGRVKWELV